MGREMSSGVDVTARHWLQLSKGPKLPNLFEAHFPVRSEILLQGMGYLWDVNHWAHGKEKGRQHLCARLCSKCFPGLPHHLHHQSSR